MSIQTTTIQPDCDDERCQGSGRRPAGTHATLSFPPQMACAVCGAFQYVREECVLDHRAGERGPLRSARR